MGSKIPEDVEAALITFSRVVNKCANQIEAYGRVEASLVLSAGSRTVNY